MLTKAHAIELATNTRKSADSMRRQDESFWTLGIAYDSGRQWAYQSSELGTYVLRHLRSIVDPGRQDVRVTMNQIHRHVKRFGAALSPARIAAHCQPASGSIDDRIVADVGDKVLDAWLPGIAGLSILREKDQIRFTLGTAVVRRCMSKKQRADSVDVSHWWSNVFPWEIIRDPSACSVHPDRDEQIHGQEKAVPVDWLKRVFGVKVDTETTMGKLSEFTRQLHTAYGMGSGPGDSKIKAVLTSEWYFKDPDGDKPGWPYMLMGYIDPCQSGDTIQGISINGKPFVGTDEADLSPFEGLPYHYFTYDNHIAARWGFGIPHALIAGQDIVNLAWTQVLRVQQAGLGQWTFEDGTVEGFEKQLTGRIDVPIRWRRTGSPQQGLVTPPQRIQPPQLPPAAMEMLGAGPEWMKQAINTSDVLMGITSKRGESGAAVERKAELATAPLDQIQRDDDLVYQELLYASLVDMCQPERMRLDQAQELLGRDVPQQQIETMLRRPIKKAVKTVVLVSAAVHPQTPSDVQASVVELSNARILAPDQAQFRLQKAGIVTDTLMDGSMRKQQLEIQALIDGNAEVMPAIEDVHEYHLRALREYADSPTFLTLDPEARDRIHQHYAAHHAALQANMAPQPQVNAAMSGMPSPPNTEASSASAGAAAPAVNVM